MVGALAGRRGGDVVAGWKCCLKGVLLECTLCTCDQRNKLDSAFQLKSIRTDFSNPLSDRLTALYRRD